MALAAYFPEVTNETVFKHYLPAVGAGSHAVFGMHVLSPSLFYNVVGEYDWALANVVFFNSHIGVGLYLYYRHHMKKVSTMSRVMYSVYGSVLFNFGSTLVWATTKAVLPRSVLLRIMFGAFTSVSLLAVGREYFGYVDTLLPDD